MDKLKEKLSRLMYGRYGIDQLGNFMMWAAVAMMIFGAVVRSSLIYTLALVLIVWAEPVHSRIKSTATSAARPAISRCVCRKEKATSRSAARNAEQNSSKTPDKKEQCDSCLVM